MEVTFNRVAPTLFAASLGWEQDRLVWSNTKDTIKASTGSWFDEDSKKWMIPFDHAAGLIVDLQRKGVSVICPKNEQGEFRRYLANQERIAELSFSPYMPQGESPVSHHLLTNELRDYQQVAVKIMGLAEGGFLNADPVGVGKSIEVIADMLVNGHLDFPCLGEWDSETGEVFESQCPVHVGGYTPPPNQILFLTRAPLKYNLVKEFKKHTKISGFVTVIEGDSQEKRRALWDDPAPIKVVGYETLLIHDWFNKVGKSDNEIETEEEKEEGKKKKLSDAQLEEKYGVGPAVRSWKRVYADEFSKVKNFRAVMSRRINRMSVSHGLVGMTATPIENDLFEYYTLMDTLVPGILGRWNQFEAKHVIRGGYNGQQVIGYMNQNEISKAVAPHQLKRTKASLMPQLPPKDSRPFLIDPDGWEKAQYERIANDFLVWVQENQHRKESNAKFNPLTQALRLRQFVNSPHLVDPDYREGGSKLAVLLDLIEAYRAAGEKIVIFTQWTTTLEWLVDQLKGKWKLMAVGGSGVHNKSDRVKIEMCEQFNQPNDDHDLFLATDSLSMGVDLYGASLLIHYDSLWNPAKMLEQREGRIHRGGQESPVTCLRLVTHGTIEESIENVLFERSELADDLYSLNEKILSQKAKQTSWSDIVFGKAS